MTSVPSILDAVQLATGDPRSSSLVSTGTVIAVDAVGHLVQVAIRQDPAAVVTLPAVAARYQALANGLLTSRSPLAAPVPA